jgi:uncharacterized membrane protein
MSRAHLRRIDRPPVLAGVLLGVGLGGFVDGIVLHQILQWHHMLTSTGSQPADTLAGLETNTVADGLFHLATWIFVLVGSLLALRDWRSGRRAPSWRAYTGLLLVGWGAFNLVEGVVDHHLLGIHHVRDDVDDPMPWDLGFLCVGAAMVATGALLARRFGNDLGDRPPVRAAP